MQGAVDCKVNTTFDMCNNYNETACTAQVQSAYGLNINCDCYYDEGKDCENLQHLVEMGFFADSDDHYYSNITYYGSQEDDLCLVKEITTDCHLDEYVPGELECTAHSFET